MQKKKLALGELAVESFSVNAEEGRGTVNAHLRPTGISCYGSCDPTCRTGACVCLESVSCFAC
jgi:hypothetical protein